MTERCRLPCGCEGHRQRWEDGWRWLRRCGQRCIVEMTVGDVIRPEEEKDR